MGRPKPFAELGGRPLLAWVLESLQPLCKKVCIVGDCVEPFGRLRCQVIQDLLPDRGPMGGIYTALSSTHERELFVTACDTPFLSPLVARYLISQVGGYEIVVPRLSDGFHPLQAVYTRDCLPLLYNRLASGRLSLIDFVQDARVRVVSEQEIEPLDPQGLSFVNINTPQDLEQAVAWLNQKKISAVRGDPL